MAATDIFQGTRLPEHGQKQQLQEMASVGGVKTTPGAPAVSSEVGVPPGVGGAGLSDPIERLMGSSGDERPITDGLPDGPGMSPLDSMDPGQGEVMTKLEKLAAIALYSRSPALRAQAADTLRVLMDKRGME